MRVRLIPTGQAELLGLAECLSRVFPGHMFETVSGREEPGRRVPFNSFTSSRFRDPPEIGTTLSRLVETLAAEVYPGRDGKAADLAILLDDLELENADQPQLVVAAVKAAVRQHIEKLPQRMNAQSVKRVELALRERASFHLAVPMVEAWFFASPSVLPLTGVPDARLPPRLRDGDPEAFETDDAAFSADEAEGCTALAERNASRPNQKPQRAPWQYASRPGVPACRRERHPKAYLSWLCRDPQHERCSTYKESEHGAAAVSELDWQRVLVAPSHCCFARALIQDISDVLGSPAVALPEGDSHCLVSRSANRRDPVLRNV